MSKRLLGAQLLYDCAQRAKCNSESFFGYCGIFAMSTIKNASVSDSAKDFGDFGEWQGTPPAPVANKLCSSEKKAPDAHVQGSHVQGTYVPPPAIEIVEPKKRTKAKVASGGLLDPGVFAGKGAVSERKIIQWVFENLDVDVEPASAPSAGAWSLLNSIRKDEQLRLEFYKGIWAKLLPTKQQLEAAERFTDDGRDVFEIIDKLRAASQEAST